MRFLPGNAQHIGARQSQQDSFGFADPDDQPFIAHAGFLAIVCDGMGGMEHGDAASRTAVRAFLNAYSRKTPEESIPAALERSVLEANASVVELARALGKLEGIGTTLVATALVDRAMFYVSVGDSGIFHVSGGLMQTVNRPHVFANLLDQAVARGQITLEDALAHPERESLTSYIGAEKIDEIDRNVEPWPLEDGDTILLASDGMFKTLDLAEILACLRGNPPGWPETLVAHTLAKERESQDNVTVLSVTFESETRATVPRTVLLAPPPPSTAGVPVESAPELPRTVMAPPVIEPPPPAFASALPIPSLPMAAELAPARAKSRGLLLLLASVLVLVAAGAGGWWYWTHRTPAGVSGSPSAPGLPVKGPKRDPNQPIPERKPTEVEPLHKETK